MKFPWLKALVAVVDSGSFSQAALELEVSQSSVSEAIVALESSLGAKLLERGRFGARPTPLGSQVLLHARVSLRALEGIEQEVTLAKGGLRGKVRIAAFRSVAGKIITPIMAALQAEHPGIEIDLLERPCNLMPMIQMLHAAETDMAFLSENQFDGVLGWKLFTDPLMALYPSKWAKTLEEVGPARLCSKTVITSNEGDSQRLLHLYFEQHGQKPPQIVTVREDLTMLQMVAQGLGVCIMPRFAVDFVPPGVKMLPLTEPLERHISIAVRQGALRLPAVKVFLNMLRQQIPHSDLPHFEMGLA
jgi:DNA-binding transcriptional LysR family regulator